MTLRVLIVTGTRADFGLWQPILREASRRGPEISAALLVTAMHLDPRFGGTISEVRSSGWPIAAEVPCTPEGDALSDMSIALGVAISRMTPVLDAQRPDWLVLLGDRGEQAAAALVALHLEIPVAHIHGGEVSRGAVDDTLRDVISRVAHLHLAANEGAAARLRAMGEESWRIHVVGAPGLDLLREEAQTDIAELRRRYGLGEGGYIIVLHHPETRGTPDPLSDLTEVLRAVEDIHVPVLAIFPNADAGGRAMAELLARTPGVHAVPSLPRGEFAPLLANASVLVGNSSSGLIEAPLLGVPAVNVGERQAGRMRGDNVLDVPADASSIADAIRRAMNDAFRRNLSRVSPYGDGYAAPRIVDLLLSTRRTPELLLKHVGTDVLAN